jgi:nitrate/TMAO reductase-like tetraheme cytochrome c subunit
MKVRIIFATLLIAGFAALIGFITFGTGSPPENPPRQFMRSESCRECHPEVYAEWESSWHAKAWVDPFVREQSDNFKNKDCIPCHAPRPVFERGIRSGERVVERASNRGVGVDCISCHRLPEGGFAAASKDPEGPCGPVHRPELLSAALCAPCHNQHDTVNEWLDSPAQLKGENCNDCHMPVVERKGRNSDPLRRGRDHSSPGGHSVELLKKSYSLYHEVKEENGIWRLKVRIVNDKTGHNLPADSRHRALDLILTLYRPGGLPYEAMDGEREYGQGPGTYRKRFRNPYRSEQKENTQIPSGGEAVLDVPIPDKAQRAVIQVIYKLTPFLLDEEGVQLDYREVTF